MFSMILGNIFSYFLRIHFTSDVHRKLPTEKPSRRNTKSQPINRKCWEIRILNIFPDSGNVLLWQDIVFDRISCWNCTKFGVSQVIWSRINFRISCNSIFLCIWLWSMVALLKSILKKTFFFTPHMIHMTFFYISKSE